MPESLRLLSFGAGAIGTYIGGSLALSGHTVVFLERSLVAAEIRQNGLRLEFPGETKVVSDPVIVSTLSEALNTGPFDVALFALKSFDTLPALQDFSPYAASLPPMLSLQNGVENEAHIAEVLGSSKTLSGTVTSAIGRLAAGQIVLERLRGMGIADHPLAGRLVDACNQAGLNARLYPEAAAMKWSKMLTNLLANATSAILDMTPAQIFNHPGLFQLEIRQLRETLAVMDRHQIKVVDLPGTPVRLLAFGVRYLPTWLSQPLLQRAIGKGRGGKMPSFHIDLYSGRGQSEVDYLNGAVVRYGASVDLPTPVNARLNKLLQQLSRGEIPLDLFRRQPEKLISYCTRP